MALNTDRKIVVGDVQSQVFVMSTGKNTMRHFEKHLVILSGRISSVYNGFS